MAQSVKYSTSGRREGYAATPSKFNPKDFYITLPRRGGDSTWSMPEKWNTQALQIQRPASSPLDAFLLPADDPRIHRARERLLQEATRAMTRGRAKIDWSRRPFRFWEECGKSNMPDWTWRDWGVVDITLLRYAKEDWDPSYTTLVWNLSQNVDRQIGSGVVGVSPCLTPSKIPYVTHRGGPMTGLEALALQGSPNHELLLTRETEDNLADLAGNAMTSTVVGSATMAAL
ncbi:hypothetical protein CALCODRAFT_488886 [Calocera cornea HHB12733]|uniref:Uncharacterized protein n=1 Tax=Calocera cornea HHB12733 TaxID=1353952 RepID=A0A165C3R7_9BASI|nr:hypothetical protein CALCODRAFT_488886 [Calocera cornea HHB12733]